MEEEEKKSSFKVEDRRRFSSEGELKPEFQKDEPAPAAAPPPPPPRPDSSAQTNFTEVTGAARPASDSGDADGEMTFAAFLVGISTQALVHLGEIPDPQGGPPEVNLGAAQQLIDIVGMLRDKTRGNLDKDEAALLDSILFELRMKFVERSHKA